MRGAFGHIPGGGSGTNLTSMIRSLRDQQTAAQDKAIFDAYQNGGTYNGKPVTDAIIVAYIQGRQAMYSKDDPLYSQWGDTLFQTKFSIGEQKIQLAYKQGKVGAGAVAQFYRDQLNSIPKDSAFGRTVADHAATWAKAAGGAARAGATARVKTAFQSTLNPQFAAISKYDGVAAYIKNAAVQAGLLTDAQSLSDVKNAQGLEDLVNRMSSDAALTKFLGHPLNFTAFTQLAQAKFAALNTVIYRSTKVGTKVVSASALKSLETQRSNFITELHQTNAIDPRAAYQAANSAFEQNMARLKGDPNGQWAEVQRYAQQLQGIGQKAANQPYGSATQVDPNFVGGINNEINALLTGKVNGPTVQDVFNGSKLGGTTSTTYADALATEVWGKPATASSGSQLGIQGARQMIAEGKGFLGQTDPGSAFTVQPYAPGSQVLADGSHGLARDQAVMWITGADGYPEPVVMKGQVVNQAPQYVWATTAAGHNAGDPVDPNSLGGFSKPGAAPWNQGTAFEQAIHDGSIIVGTADKANPTHTIGYQYTDQSGNVTWGVVNPITGGVTYTDTNPFGTISTSQAAADGAGSTLYAQTPPDPAAVLGGVPVFTSQEVSPQDLQALVNSGKITDPSAIQYVATQMTNFQNNAKSYAGMAQSYANAAPPQSQSDAYKSGEMGGNPQIKLPGLGASGANGSYGATNPGSGFQTPWGSPPELKTPGIPGLTNASPPPTTSNYVPPPSPAAVPTVKSTYVAPPATAFGNPNASPPPTTNPTGTGSTSPSPTDTNQQGAGVTKF